MKISLILMSVSFAWLSDVVGQGNIEAICDTSSHNAYPLDKGSQSPISPCDAYIISKYSFERFQFLNNEYKNSLFDYAQLDSMFTLMSNGFIENTERLTLIYQEQKKEITDMTTTTLPSLETSISELFEVKSSLELATTSLDSALKSIKKAKGEKWIYAGGGFLIGGLTLMLLSN